MIYLRETETGREKERDRETDKNVTEQSVTARHAGSLVYPKQDQTIPSCKKSMSEQTRDYIYQKDGMQSIFLQFPCHLLHKGNR